MDQGTTIDAVESPAPPGSDPPVCWIGWKDGKPYGHGAESRESYLISYDIMSLTGIEATADALAARGIDVLKTAAEIAPRPGRDGWALARGGRIVVGALGYSCCEDDPEKSRRSAAAWLSGKHRNDCELDRLPDISGADMATLRAYYDAWPDRDNPDLPANGRRPPGRKAIVAFLEARRAGRETLERLGFEAVPLRLRPLEEPPKPVSYRRPGYSISRRVKVDVDALVDPSRHVGFRELEVFAWFARTAHPAGPDGVGPYELLSATSGINCSGITPIGGPTWREQLERRLRYVVSKRSLGASQEAWKASLGIAQGAVLTLALPRAESDGTLYPSWGPGGVRLNAPPGEKLDGLLGEDGWLAWRLNTQHAWAVRIHHVEMHFGEGGVSFWVEYGYADDSSSWHYPLVFQRRGEPLKFTVDRAVEALARLKDPRAAPPPTGFRAREVAEPADPPPPPGRIVGPVVVEQAWRSGNTWNVMGGYPERGSGRPTLARCRADAEGKAVAEALADAWNRANWACPLEEQP